MKAESKIIVKKRLQHKCFPVGAAKFLKTLILKNIWELLLLHLLSLLPHLSTGQWEFQSSVLCLIWFLLLIYFCTISGKPLLSCITMTQSYLNCWLEAVFSHFLEVSTYLRHRFIFATKTA